MTNVSDDRDPQDISETLDEDRIDDPEGAGIDFPSDTPWAVEEELVTEPIVDSVASREARLHPEAPDDPENRAGAAEADEIATDDEPDLSEQLISDEVNLVADALAPTAEEAAVHVRNPEE